MDSDGLGSLVQCSGEIITGTRVLASSLQLVARVCEIWLHGVGSGPKSGRGGSMKLL